jgi:DNA polymerase III delta prime subunit
MNPAQPFIDYRNSQIVNKEVVKLVLAAFEGTVKTSLLKLLLSIPKTVAVILANYYCGNCEKLLTFIKSLVWNLVKHIIYSKTVFNINYTSEKDIDHFIAKEFLQFNEINNGIVNFLPIYIRNIGCDEDEYPVVEVYFVNIIHNATILSIKQRAEEKFNLYKSKLNKTVYYKYDAGYKVQTPYNLYSSKNYLELKNIVEADIVSSKIVKSYSVFGILIDGEPGLGKSSFSDFIATQGVVGNVYRADLSTESARKKDHTALFNDIFHDKIISDSCIFMIDEMDKYLDYRINSTYVVIREIDVFTNKPIEPSIYEKEKSFRSHSIKYRTEFLYALLGVLERSGLNHPCTVIFCSNNFESIFNGLDMTHFESIKSRFARVKFNRCDRLEISEYIRYYNKKLEGTKFHKTEIEQIIEKLKPDMTVTYRNLHQITKLSSFDFALIVNKLNSFSDLKPVINRAKKIIESIDFNCLNLDNDIKYQELLPKKATKPVTQKESDNEETTKIDTEQQEEEEIYDHTKDEKLPEEIRLLSYEEIDYTKIDPSNYLTVFQCKCKSLRIDRTGFCQCIDCSKNKESVSFIKGSVVDLLCHDCLLESKGTPRKSDIQYIETFDEKQINRYIKVISVTLNEIENKKESVRKRMIVLLYKYIGNNIDIVNSNRMKNFRKRTIEKIKDFFQSNPDFVVAHAEFFTTLVSKFRPIC